MRSPAVLLALAAAAAFAGEPITLTCNREHVSGIIGQISMQTGVQIELDESCEGKGLSRAAVLDLVVAQLDAAWEVRYGVVCVASKSLLAAVPGERLEGFDHLESTLTLARSSGSVTDVLGRIAAGAGLRLKVSAAAQEVLHEATVSLHVIDLPVGEALSALLLPRGLWADIRGGDLFVTD